MNTALLTIDDVASRNTPAIVDYLVEKNIKAVLFATGTNLERFFDQARYAVQKGMIVGNHSYSHPAFSTLAPQECFEEIRRCEALLDRLYRESGVERRYRPFRFPYGDKGGANKAVLQAFLRENGFHKLNDAHIPYPWWKENNLHTDIDTLWTFDFEEYRMAHEEDFTLDTVWQKMYNPAPQLGGALFAPGHRHILLLHAFDETEAKLPGYYRILLDHLLEQGLTFDEPRFMEQV